jgi:hypothetical protein
MMTDAVVRNVEVIGEAANRLTADFLSDNPQIEWRKIIATRNRIIHGYVSVDLEIIWNIAQRDLARLKTEIERILEDLGWRLSPRAPDGVRRRGNEAFRIETGRQRRLVAEQAAFWVFMTIAAAVISADWESIVESVMFDILGWIGAFLLLLAYALVSFRRVAADSQTYQWMNIVASVLLAVNTLYHQAYPSSFVNIIWTFIAVFAIVTIRKRYAKTGDQGWVRAAGRSAGAVSGYAGIGTAGRSDDPGSLKSSLLSILTKK